MTVTKCQTGERNPPARTFINSRPINLLVVKLPVMSMVTKLVRYAKLPVGQKPACVSIETIVRMSLPIEKKSDAGCLCYIGTNISKMRFA